MAIKGDYTTLTAVRVPAALARRLTSLSPSRKPLLSLLLVLLLQTSLSNGWSAEPLPLLKVAVELRLKERVVTPGSELHGELYGLDKLRGEVVRILWVDALGRICGLVELPTAEQALPETAAFALKVNGGIGCRQRLIVLTGQRSKKHQTEPDVWRIVAETSFILQRLAGNRTTFGLIEVAAPQSGSERNEEVLHTLGVNGVLARAPLLQSLNTPALAERGIRIAELFGATNPLSAWSEPVRESMEHRFMLSRNEAELRQLSIFEQAAGEQYQRELRQALEGLSGQGLHYEFGQRLALGERNSPLPYVLGATELEIFQAWLQRQYRTLEALNADWGTDFGDWHQIAPPSLDAIFALNPRYAELLSLLKTGDPEAKLPRRNDVPYFNFKLQELPVPGSLNENFAGWIAYRKFLDFVLSRLLAEQKSLVQRLDPGALIGVGDSIVPAAWGGQDPLGMLKQLDWYLLSNSGEERALVRSFRPEIARYQPVDLRAPAARYRLWRSWMEEDNGVVLEGLHDQALQQSGELTALGVDLAGDAALLHRTGLQALREAGRSLCSPVGIYYSPQSLQVGSLQDSQLSGSDWYMRKNSQRHSGLRALESWQCLIEDLGYRPQFLHADQLLEGRALPVKLLVLPRVLSMGTREAEVLREFVRLGGIVIADAQCGLFDEQGRRRPLLRQDFRSGGALDDAFGVRRESLWAHVLGGQFHGDTASARIQLEDPLSRNPAGPYASELRIDELGLRSVDGWQYGRTALGSAAMIGKSGGLGRFIYLNMDVGAYREQRAHETTDFQLHGMHNELYRQRYGSPTGGEAFRILLGDLLSEALGEPPVNVRRLDNLPLRFMHRSVWQCGLATLIAVMPDPTGIPPQVNEGERAERRWPEKGWLSFNKIRHWYDPIERRYLGLGGGCEVSLHPERPSFVTTLPYRVDRLEARVRRTSPLGVFSLEVEMKAVKAGIKFDGKLGTHVLRLELFGPDGAPLRYYDRDERMEEGKWRGTVAFALNEPAGTYRLCIRDIVTGTSREVYLQKDTALYERVLPVTRFTTQAR